MSQLHKRKQLQVSDLMTVSVMLFMEARVVFMKYMLVYAHICVNLPAWVGHSLLTQLCVCVCVCV